MRGKLLLVDDDEAVLDFLTAKLGADCDIISTGNPENAVRLAREHAPDLVVCDIDMPDMDGGDISAAMFANEQTREIPMVFLTALVSSKELAAKGGQVGGRAALSKDLPPEQLVASIRKLIER